MGLRGFKDGLNRSKRGLKCQDSFTWDVSDRFFIIRKC